MPRPEKVAAVAEIKERIEGAKGVFITEYRGLTVKQMQALRRALRETGARFQVVKMTLARRATEELGLGEITQDLAGPSGIAYADTDAVATAKALTEIAKQYEKLVIKSGILEGKVIPPEKVAAIAELESREILLSKIAGAAKAPLAKMAGMFGSFTRDAASMFAQLLEKSGPVPVAAVPEEPALPPVTPEAEAVAEDEMGAEAESAEAPAADESAAAVETSVDDELAAVAETPVDDVTAASAETPVEDEPAASAEEE